MTGSLLAGEMREQPGVVEALLRSGHAAVAEAAARARSAEARWVLIAARGTSDNAARYAQHVFGRLCGLPVALATPSLSTIYAAQLRLPGALVIGISQSGESPDVRAVLEDARAQGSPTVAITNVAGSPLTATADTTIELGAGPERSVAATKTYTASLAALGALAAELCGERALRAELERVPEAMELQLATGVGAAAAVLGPVERCAVAGRGPNYATAFEAALKIKELTAIAAEPYSPADLMHGPVAVLGATSPLLALAIDGPALASVMDAVEQAAARGARRLLFCDGPHARGGEEQVIVPLVPQPEWLSPLIAILPAQALAAELAVARGIDVDAPFGLSKVTRTV